MNPMMMMAMAVAMSHRSNASSTVQTVLGASDSLGQTGRLAVGMMRQRTDEQDREVADRRIGKELGELLAANRINPDQLEKYPALKRVALLGGATVGTPMLGAAAPHQHAAAPPQSVGPASPGLASLAPHTPVEPKHAVAVRAGNLAGLERLVTAADASVTAARRDAANDEAAAKRAEAEAKVAAEAAAAAEAEAKKDAAKPELAAKAAEAKKKSDDALLAADAARGAAVRSAATAHAIAHAAKDLAARLAAEC